MLTILESYTVYKAKHGFYLKSDFFFVNLPFFLCALEVLPVMQTQ